MKAAKNHKKRIIFLVWLLFILLFVLFPGIVFAISEYRIPLKTGWNMISTPFDLEKSNLKDALSSIDGKYNYVYSYSNGEWKFYISGYEQASSLKELKPGEGYWIYMNSEGNLTFRGNLLKKVSIPLKRGWNMIGYPSLEPRDVKDVLFLIDGKYSSISTFSGGSRKSYIVDAPKNSLEKLFPGEGYWISMTQDAVLEIENSNSPGSSCKKTFQPCLSNSECCSNFCVDGFCRYPIINKSCNADNAKDESIEDGLDDKYCTWNEHDNCLVRSSIEIISGQLNPTYWEGDSCSAEDNGTSDLYGEKKVYVDNLEKYKIEGKLLVDDFAYLWINDKAISNLQGVSGETSWVDLTPYFNSGWNLIKFKAVDSCSGNRYFKFEIKVKKKNGYECNKNSECLSNYCIEDIGNGKCDSEKKICAANDSGPYVCSCSLSQDENSGDIKITWNVADDVPDTPSSSGKWVLMLSNSYNSEIYYDSKKQNECSKGTTFTKIIPFSSFQKKPSSSVEIFAELSEETCNNKMHISSLSNENINKNEGYCNTTLKIKIPEGYSCNSNEDCLSGFCIDNICKKLSEEEKNLRAHLSLDEGFGNVAKDSSMYKNNGNVQGASWTESKFGKALSFDENSFIEIKNSESLNPRDEITISYWIKPNCDDNDMVILSKQGIFENELKCGNRTFFFRSIINETLKEISFTENLNANEWYYIVETYDGNTVKIYVNSELKSSMNASGKLSQSKSSLFIGKKFKGIIDEIKIYSYALSPLEILQNYLLSEKVLHLELNENSGIVAHDSSIFRNDGTIYGGSSWVEGILGKALYFDGKDDYIVVEEDGSLNEFNEITLGVWIYRKSQGANWIFGRNFEHDISLENEKIKVSMKDLSIENWSIELLVPLNEWTHIAVTYNRTSIKIYKNSELVAEKKAFGKISTKEPLYIGKYFNGKLDEILIFSRALTEQEIKKYFYQGYRNLLYKDFNIPLNPETGSGVTGENSNSGSSSASLPSLPFAPLTAATAAAAAGAAFLLMQSSGFFSSLKQSLGNNQKQDYLNKIVDDLKRAREIALFNKNYWQRVLDGSEYRRWEYEERLKAAKAEFEKCDALYQKFKNANLENLEIISDKTFKFENELWTRENSLVRKLDAEEIPNRFKFESEELNKKFKENLEKINEQLRKLFNEGKMSFPVYQSLIQQAINLRIQERENLNKLKKLFILEKDKTFKKEVGFLKTKEFSVNSLLKEKFLEAEKALDDSLEWFKNQFYVKCLYSKEAFKSFLMNISQNGPWYVPKLFSEIKNWDANKLEIVGEYKFKYRSKTYIGIKYDGKTYFLKPHKDKWYIERITDEEAVMRFENDSNSLFDKFKGALEKLRDKAEQEMASLDFAFRADYLNKVKDTARSLWKLFREKLNAKINEYYNEGFYKGKGLSNIHEIDREIRTYGEKYFKEFNECMDRVYNNLIPKDIKDKQTNEALRKFEEKMQRWRSHAKDLLDHQYRELKERAERNKNGLSYDIIKQEIDAWYQNKLSNLDAEILISKIKNNSSDIMTGKNSEEEKAITFEYLRNLTKISSMEKLNKQMEKQIEIAQMSQKPQQQTISNNFPVIEDPKPEVYLKGNSLYVQKPDGNYLIYNYDKLKEKFQGRDPRKMSPREVFDTLYGKDSEYNPYSQRYYTNTATTTTESA
ncbi:MAG: LamG-like jellyroll fold domain-containing protein, partial [Candidatus Altiarchaeota archaeon]